METLNKILQHINNSKNELRITTNNGEVHINTNTFDFTYMGLFGNTILNHCITKQVMNDNAKKLIIVAAHVDEYSKRIGGVNFITY